MLEGKEIDVKFDGDAGEFSVDVDMKGAVAVTLTYVKSVDDWVDANAAIGMKTNIFKIAEKIAAKTATTWDDTAIAALEKLLGIAPSVPPVAAPAAPAAQA